MAIFMKIETIPGECSDDKHKDWFQLESFSHGVSQTITRRSGVGAPVGGLPVLQDAMVTKMLDLAAPKMTLACCKGTNVKKVQIEFVRSTGDKSKYLSYDLEDCVISSYQISASGMQESGVPTEVIAFNFSKLTETYYTTDQKSGVTKGNTPISWNLNTNSEK